ncbi:MAG: hypothetical protein V8S08_03145 [Lachnoclostridium sp.]
MKIEKDMSTLAIKVKRAKKRKPGFFIRLMFLLMASAKKGSKEDSYDANEARYWKENGWLDGERPWR